MKLRNRVVLCLLGLGLVGLAFVLWPREGAAPAPRPTARARAVEAPIREAAPGERAEVVPAATRASDGAEADVQARPSPLTQTAAEEWPPQRAFTARCRAPGGGCAPQCTALAGDRCLDPCFIHTDTCSPDCKQPDGSCGWPPPDNE